MFFRKKLKRVLTDPKKAEERFAKTMEEAPPEKGDRLAMVLAALIVFIPALLLVFAVFGFVVYFFFLRHIFKRRVRPACPAHRRYGLKAAASCAGISASSL